MDPAQLISSQVHVAGAGFVSLEQALRNSSQYAVQVPPAAVVDAFERFKIWAGNIAAHRKGRRSLEYRLRDAAHLKDETHSLLIALHESLQRALAIVTGLRKPWDEFSDSDSDSGSDFEGSQDGTEINSTELGQLLANIKSTVTCLFRLSMAVRDPAPESQHRSTITVDKSYFEVHDIMHVKAKFPACADHLAERLGRAISGRRQYLSYREAHHQKLAKKAELIGHEEPKTDYTNTSTEATQLPPAHTDTPEVLIDDETFSQTSYASSANSRATIRVPPLPKEAHDQEHFECPFCFMIVSIHTNAAWKQHVYKDLHPYCCTFEFCTTSERLYDSRHDWFNHELEAHRALWQCIEGCDKKFQSESDYETHVSAQHPDLASPNMLSILKHTSRRGANLFREVTCPLCNMSCSLRAFQRHVGRHQEHIALFALPIQQEEGETDDGSNQEIASIERAESFMNSASDVGIDEDDDDYLDYGVEAEDVALHNGPMEPVISKDKHVSKECNDAQEDDLVDVLGLMEQSLETSMAGLNKETVKFVKQELASRDRGNKGKSKRERLEATSTIEADESTVARPVNTEESWAAYYFEVHARDCVYCKDPYEVHRSREQLCETGHRLAQDVGALLHNGSDGTTRSTNGDLVHLPAGYTQGQGLLKAIERSIRHRSRTPFVSQDRAYYVAPRSSSTVHSTKVEQAPQSALKPRARARPRPRSGEIIDWPSRESKLVPPAGFPSEEGSLQSEASGQRKVTHPAAPQIIVERRDTRKRDKGKRKQESQGLPEDAPKGSQYEIDLAAQRRNAGSLYETDLAEQRRNAAKYSVEIREPSARDLREHRLSGYYR
ncbi:hypothetical protein BDV95DRAFT_284582 [Massariosphaeria phaeospora]|uniref:C2H2-type domain-containing protein n=1 Tax=Massariosphaeria phaeospora TaxID=100035 RepID=A0A7C8MFU4_9PLEO|nr:hypothetical protein BDV95DRAFT_284582 [Massariosphaeria phaeospora]